MFCWVGIVFYELLKEKGVYVVPNFKGLDSPTIMAKNIELFWFLSIEWAILQHVQFYTFLLFGKFVLRNLNFQCTFMEILTLEQNLIWGLFKSFSIFKFRNFKI